MCKPALTQTCVHIHTPHTQMHIHKDQKRKKKEKKIELEHKLQKGKKKDIYETHLVAVTSRGYENQQEKYKLRDK